jgi:hypothetical protein
MFRTHCNAVPFDHRAGTQPLDVRSAISQVDGHKYLSDYCRAVSFSVDRQLSGFAKTGSWRAGK